MKDLLILILILALVWFVWYLGGGPERYDESQGPFMHGPMENNYWR